MAETGPQALILIREWRRKHRSTDSVVAAFIAKLEADVLASPGPANGMCSMFGVWGSRSEGKKLFTGRNLDWNQNTGINKWETDWPDTTVAWQPCLALKHPLLDMHAPTRLPLPSIL